MNELKATRMISVTSSARTHVIVMVIDISDDVTQDPPQSGAGIDTADAATIVDSAVTDIVIVDVPTSSAPARKCIASRPARIAGTANSAIGSRRRSLMGRIYGPFRRNIWEPCVAGGLVSDAGAREWIATFRDVACRVALASECQRL